MDWPSPSAVMTANFGSNDGGNPLLGALFSDGDPLGAADQGELLYRRGDGESPSRLPSPLGAWLAVDHGDGIISIYGRMEDSKTAPPPRLSKSTILGRPGSSGWSGKNGFYFSLFDRKERRWINPSMIISPFPDTRPPVIQSVSLRNSAGRRIDPAQTRVLGQGRYVISVAASDTLSPEGYPLAPHRILCSVNGGEVGVLSFETYSARDGILMVNRNGLIPVKQIYAPFPAFEVGEVALTRGQVSLEIIAQDFAGNTRSVVYRLTVE
ncbi:MAG: M23 family metallopeptidase [Treponema sp.]|nr:M23 family metallopeptidase [Treponema sp.]